MSVASNIVNESGEQFIPASQRPDGTWRKARRVKEGYVPQEEVPLYESKGKQFLSKKDEPIVLPSGKTALRPIPGLFIVQDDTDKKPTKKKNKKRTSIASENIDMMLEKIKLVESPSATDKKTTKSSDISKNIETTDPQKKLKNLKKRLREIETLEEKIQKGDIAKPEPEQLAKVKRKNDLILQIYELEKQLQ
ncbi:unnamed protein product [Phaedon cochleariae]|uniref:Partner of Y14 and mago n=1 Tax=Phaedon cochleariae TaxID=80249 RepID=A0A9P0DV37_PHACE|nr:unnamed protein product [Phaedon cochleariae]